jgi:hypothetical protein
MTVHTCCRRNRGFAISPPNGHGWERGIVRLVAQDARCFYVAYVGHGEDIEVDVMQSRWRRVRKKKRKTLQFVGSGTAAPSPQITKLTAKRVRGMGMF